MFLLEQVMSQLHIRKRIGNLKNRLCESSLQAAPGWTNVLNVVLFFNWISFLELWCSVIVHLLILRQSVGLNENVELVTAELTCLEDQQVQCIISQVGSGSDLVCGDPHQQLLVVSPCEQQTAS